MIKKAALALCVFAFSSIAHAGLIEINFDELATNTVVNNVYAGVTFGTTHGNGDVSVFTACCSESDPNSIATGSGGSFNFNGDLSLSFASAVNNLSFFIGGDNDAGVVGLIDIFGLGGVLLDTVGLIADGDGQGLTEELQDLSAYSNVTGINIYNVTDAAGLVYDTFRYTVPEPGMLALLGIGLAGIGLARRRRTQ